MVEKIVLEIENRLNDKAITHEIWFDKWSMRAGAWVQDQISDGLGNSQFLILMVSANSLASGAVAAEWKVKFADKFRANDDSVFPLYLQGTEPRQAPEFLREIFGYSYRGEQDLPNVIRLADDILFWRNRER
jgi:hypothetical protein